MDVHARQQQIGDSMASKVDPVARALEARNAAAQTRAAKTPSVTPSTQPSVQQTRTKTVGRVNSPSGGGNNPPSITPIFNKAANPQQPQVKQAFNKAAKPGTQRTKTTAPAPRPTPPKLGPGAMTASTQKFDVAASREAKRQAVAKSIAKTQKTAQTRSQTQKRGLDNTAALKPTFNKHSRGH